MPVRAPSVPATSWRRALLPLVLAAAALVLSGCYRMEVDATVHEDDTVSGSMIIALSKQAIEESGGDPDTLKDALDDRAAALGDGMKVEKYDEDGYVGERITFEMTLDQFVSGSQSGVSGTVGEPLGDRDRLSLTHEGNEFVLHATYDMTPLDTTGSTRSTGASGAESAPTTEPPDIVFRFSFPGDVTESNGDIDGDTVTWRLAPGQKNVLTARAGDKAGPVKAFLTKIGLESQTRQAMALGLLVVVVALVWLVRVTGRGRRINDDEAARVAAARAEYVAGQQAAGWSPPQPIYAASAQALAAQFEAHSAATTGTDALAAAAAPDAGAESQRLTQDTPGVIYSDDRRWFWDGYDWAPVRFPPLGNG